jgi:hypothetical protein
MADRSFCELFQIEQKFTPQWGIQAETSSIQALPDGRSVSPGGGKTSAGHFCVAREGIYLREDGELVGPFETWGDAERFLELMEILGESSEGIEIVEIRGNEAKPRQDVSATERGRLIKTARSSRKPRKKGGQGKILPWRSTGAGKKTDL